MGQLAIISLCPVGALRRLSASHVPWPVGPYQRLDTVKPKAIPKPAGGPRFPLDLMPSIEKTVAKGAKFDELSAP